MTITNFDLIQIYNILESCGNKKFPQKINFAITKNFTELKPNVDIYQQALQKLFQTYDADIVKKEDGTPDIDDQGIPKLKEHQEDFNKELIDLLNAQIDLNLYQIDEDAFNYEDNDRYDVLTAQEILNLQKILCNFTEDEIKEN